MDRHCCLALAVLLQLLLCCFRLATGLDSPSQLEKRSALYCGHPDYKEVCFEETVKSRLVYTEFEPVVIRCVVRNLGKHVVTWMRNDGQDIPLTIGKTVFTPDKRIKIDYSSPDEWNLVIQRAEAKDSGEYLCQVNSKGHLDEKLFQLVVKESEPSSAKPLRRSEATLSNGGVEQTGSAPKPPKSLQNDEAITNPEAGKGIKNVNIYGPKVVFRGKQFASFTCTAVFRTRDAKGNSEATVEWYHQGLRQRSNASSMDISMSWKDGDTAVSVLTIYSVELDHSGDWICLKRPSERSGLETASHHLTVLEWDPNRATAVEQQQQQHQQQQQQLQQLQQQLQQQRQSQLYLDQFAAVPASSKSSLSSSSSSYRGSVPAALLSATVAVLLTAILVTF